MGVSNGAGSNCIALGGNHQNVQASSAPVVVTHQVPLCTVGTGGATTCAGTVTVTNTQDNLKGYLDKNGNACVWSPGGGNTNCWYERKAQYQLKDCTNDSCGWVDIKLVTRPLVDASHPPYNPDLDKTVAFATREVNFGFNKFALEGGRTIQFTCADPVGGPKSFATQIDYKTNKAICSPLNTSTIQNNPCPQWKRINSFGNNTLSTACVDMPNSSCGTGYASLTLSSAGGTICR